MEKFLIPRKPDEYSAAPLPPTGRNSTDGDVVFLEEKNSNAIPMKKKINVLAKDTTTASNDSSIEIEKVRQNTLELLQTSLNKRQLDVSELKSLNIIVKKEYHDQEVRWKITYGLNGVAYSDRKTLINYLELRKEAKNKHTREDSPSAVLPVSSSSDARLASSRQLTHEIARAGYLAACLTAMPYQVNKEMSIINFGMPQTLIVPEICRLCIFFMILLSWILKLAPLRHSH